MLANKIETLDMPDHKSFIQVFEYIWGSEIFHAGKSDKAWSGRWKMFNRFMNVGAWTEAAILLVPTGCQLLVRDDEEAGAFANVSRLDATYEVTVLPVDVNEEAEVSIMKGRKQGHNYSWARTKALAICAACVRAKDG